MSVISEETIVQAILNKEETALNYVLDISLYNGVTVRVF